jgi:hypothetical protein
MSSAFTFAASSSRARESCWLRLAPARRARAFGRFATEHEHLRAVAERRREAGMLGAFERRTVSMRTRTCQATQRFELGATELHRHRTDDDAESRACEINGNVFDDVRQLRDEHVISPQSGVRERDQSRVDQSQ